MTYPTVHLNGTPGDDLLEQVLSAINAIDAAGDALAEATPNARDYYVQGSGAFAEVKDEHFLRVSKLFEVRKELGLIAENICEQNDAIAERKRGVR